MPSTPYLNIPQVTPTQSQKETTINDAIVALEGAITSTLAVSFAAATTVTLTEVQFTRNYIFECNAATAASTLKLPRNVNGSPSKRVFGVRNTSGFPITIISDAVSPGTSVTMPTGECRLFGFSGGNVYIASEAGTTARFLDLVDVNPSYAGKAGYLVVVKNTEDGLDFQQIKDRISRLTDVDWTTPATNGQILVYNSTSGKFVPSTPTVGTFTGLSDGPGAFTGQANKHVRVNGAASALEYVPAPLEVPAPITADIGKVLAATAAGAYSWQPAAAGSSTLASLTDVTIPSPTNGYVLTYDSTLAKWKAAAPTGGGSSLPTLTGNKHKVLSVTDDETAAEWVSDGRTPLVARYWRVKMISFAPVNSYGGRFGICNLQFLDYSGTNVSASTTTGFADSDAGVFGGVPAAFDGGTSIRHGWLSNTGSGTAYIGFDALTPVAIHTVHFQNIDAYINTCGGTVAVEWSSDNVTWTETVRKASIEDNGGGSPQQTIAVTARVLLLASLADVNETTPPTDGQALVYDNASKTWKPKSRLLSTLSDVITTGGHAPSDGQALVWNAADGKWEPATVSGGGGGGGGSGRLIAAARIDCSTPASPVIAYGVNVASIVKTGTGRYTINFTTPIDPTKVTFSAGGAWSANPSVEIAVVGIDRGIGLGLTTTSISIMHYYINPAAIAIFDCNNWFSFELNDASAAGSGSGVGTRLLIQEINLSADAANIDFTGIPQTFKHLELRIQGWSTSTNAGLSEVLVMHFNGDTAGGNYETTGFGVYGGAPTGFPSPGGVLLSSGNNPQPRGQATIQIQDYRDTSGDQFWHGVSQCRQASAGLLDCRGGGRWSGAAALNDITLIAGASNWKAGTKAQLYGIV